MPLDGDQTNQLTIDAGNGLDAPSIPGDEALAYFLAVKKDVEKIQAAGGIVDLPNH